MRGTRGTAMTAGTRPSRVSQNAKVADRRADARSQAPTSPSPPVHTPPFNRHERLRRVQHAREHVREVVVVLALWAQPTSIRPRKVPRRYRTPGRCPSTRRPGRRRRHTPPRGQQQATRPVDATTRCGSAAVEDDPPDPAAVFGPHEDLCRHSRRAPVFPRPVPTSTARRPQGGPLR